jgi:histidine triad (HIT) family protein
MEPSVFTRIIRGELPSHKIYEDDKTIAFLDIHPSVPGYTLVVPKVQVDRLEDLSDDDYAAVMSTVKKVMRRMVDVYGKDYRACLKVWGYEVPHAHIRVIPCHTSDDFLAPQDEDAEPDHAALAAEAKKLAF